MDARSEEEARWVFSPLIARGDFVDCVFFREYREIGMSLGIRLGGDEGRWIGIDSICVALRKDIAPLAGCFRGDILGAMLAAGSEAASLLPWILRFDRNGAMLGRWDDLRRTSYHQVAEGFRSHAIDLVGRFRAKEVRWGPNGAPDTGPWFDARATLEDGRSIEVRFGDCLAPVQCTLLSRRSGPNDAILRTTAHDSVCGYLPSVESASAAEFCAAYRRFFTEFFDKMDREFAEWERCPSAGARSLWLGESRLQRLRYDGPWISLLSGVASAVLDSIGQRHRQKLDRHHP